MNRYIVKSAGPNFFVRDTLTGETAFGTLTRYEHEAIAWARRHNAEYGRFRAQLPRPIVEPTNEQEAI